MYACVRSSRPAAWRFIHLVNSAAEILPEPSASIVCQSERRSRSENAALSSARNSRWRTSLRSSAWSSEREPSLSIRLNMLYLAVTHTFTPAAHWVAPWLHWAGGGKNSASARRGVQGRIGCFNNYV